MAHKIIYGPIKSGEEKQVIDLVLSVFAEFVAPGYSEEGINEFKKFANFEALASRLQSASLTFTAKSNENLIGMIELMNNCHIAMFFVRKSYQKQGIGKGLLRYAINLCLKQHPARINSRSTHLLMQYLRMKKWDLTLPIMSKFPTVSGLPPWSLT